MIGDKEQGGEELGRNKKARKSRRAEGSVEEEGAREGKGGRGKDSRGIRVGVWMR